MEKPSNKKLKNNQVSYMAEFDIDLNSRAKEHVTKEKVLHNVSTKPVMFYE